MIDNEGIKKGEKYQLSIISARSKLKEVEDQIYSARNRINVLNAKSSKFEYQSLGKSIVNGAKDEVREVVDQRKKAGQEYLTRRSMEIKAHHSQNINKKKEHQDKLMEMKNMIQTQNKWVYEAIKIEKEKNLRLIDEERMKERSIKRQNRDCMAEEELKRSEYLRSYFKTKEFNIKKEKCEEASKIQERIKEQQKFLQKLEKKSSDLMLNPELSSRIRYSKNSRSDTERDQTADAYNNELR